MVSLHQISIIATQFKDIGMAAGKGWKLTDKRLAEITDMLGKQHTLTSIAVYFGIATSTLGLKLKDAGISYKDLQLAGIANLRAEVFTRLREIQKPTEFTAAAIKVLDKYDVVVDTEEVKVVDTKAITKQIMDELDG